MTERLSLTHNLLNFLLRNFLNIHKGRKYILINLQITNINILELLLFFKLIVLVCFLLLPSLLIKIYYFSIHLKCKLIKNFPARKS